MPASGGVLNNIIFEKIVKIMLVPIYNLVKPCPQKLYSVKCISRKFM